jgi:phospholipid/cholesterol/gamma-HCH transport system substrate-binding protein
MLTARARRSEYVKAGVTLGVGLLVLAVFMVILGGNWFWEKYDSFDIRFTSVKDLSTGRPVKYAGLDVGRVEAIVLDPKDPRYIRVRIGVRRDFPLFQGTVARIAQKGLVGDYYVLLEIRGEPGERLQPSAVIPAVVTMDVQELAAKAGEMLDGIRPKIDEIADNIDKLFSAENTEALRKALEGTPQLVADLRQAANDFRTNWVSLATKAGRTSETLDVTLKRMDRAVGTAESELKQTLESLRTETLVAGSLVKDVHTGFNYDQEIIEEILSNLNKTSRETKELIRHLRERPWEVLRPPSGSAK